jgi:hypothetical protein
MLTASLLHVIVDFVPDGGVLAWIDARFRLPNVHRRLRTSISFPQNDQQPLASAIGTRRNTIEIVCETCGSLFGS